MDDIVIPHAKLIQRGTTCRGRLELRTHHMLFHVKSSKKVQWFCYPMIQYAERRPHSIGGFSAIRIRCRDFVFLTLHFEKESDCISAFNAIKNMTCVPTIEKLYAFTYFNNPPPKERCLDGWNIYSPEKEFKRQGLGTTFPQWRLTDLNHDYVFSPTYPAVLAIPTSISDNVLNYGGKYRSKARVPVLSYIHRLNGCTITRASQPMVGIKQNRSLQDEKLILSIFDSTSQQPDVYGSTASGHLIVDARPTANAMANVAMGAGSENMDHYPTAKKVYLGIENIHVMRDSLTKLVEAIKDSDLTPLPPNRDMLQKSNWLRHICNVLDGATIVARTVHLGGSHVLVHCSDGWDRTSQLCSIAELCLDPFYRTLEGFIILVEKDWVSFGHRFAERCGHLPSEKTFVNSSSSKEDKETQPGGAQSETPQTQQSRAQNAFQNLSKKLGEVKFNVGNQSSHLKYTAPIFHQFLDCVFQILTQHPTKFEFNERFLKRVLYHTYSCQYGTFLHNNERERSEANVRSKTRSVWEHFLARRTDFTNPLYEPSDPTSRRHVDEWLQVDTTKVKFWASVFNRTDEEMNASGLRSEAGAGAETPVIGQELGDVVAKQERYREQQDQPQQQQPEPQQERSEEAQQQVQVQVQVQDQDQHNNRESSTVQDEQLDCEQKSTQAELKNGEEVWEKNQACQKPEESEDSAANAANASLSESFHPLCEDWVESRWKS